MNEVKISIILPAYNVEPYIKKCIDSILNQTFKDYELIIINDGSTDNTGNIINEYKDKRIQVITQVNKGLSVARNVGIDIAKGKYITFIDSDDYIDYKYLEILYKIISTNEADIVMCEKIKTNEKYKSKRKIVYNFFEKEISKQDAYEIIILGKKIRAWAWAKIYNSKIFKEYNIRYPKDKIYEDYFIINKILEKCNKIMITNYNGYFYLQRDNSITNKTFYAERMHFIEAVTSMSEFIEKKYPKLHDTMIYGYVNANLATLRSATKSNGFKNEKETLRNNILKLKKEIFKNKLFKIPEKVQVFFLLFGNIPFKLLVSIYNIIKRKC